MSSCGDSHINLHINRKVLRETLAANWTIEAITPLRFTVRTDIELQFTKGGPHAWFVVAGRI